MALLPPSSNLISVQLLNFLSWKWFVHLSFPYGRFSGSKKSELWIQYLQISLGMILHVEVDRWCKTECCLRLVTNFVHRHFTGLDIWRHGCRVHRREGGNANKNIEKGYICLDETSNVSFDLHWFEFKLICLNNNITLYLINKFES